MLTYWKGGQTRIRTAQPASSTPTLAQLDVLDPEESDVDFILHAFDSSLPYLASIGSQAQWGTALFSEKPERRKQFTDWVQVSYDLLTSNTEAPSSTTPWQHMVLYEVKTADAKWKRVAAQGASERFPDYVPQDLADSTMRHADNYHYLNYLIADRRAGTLAKGAAAQLVTFAQEQARARNKTIFYGDCWRGNNDGLMKYYQGLGFSPLGHFAVKDKHGPGLHWLGYLFSKTISD